MKECTSCGGTVRYIKGGLMKCEYCGRLYSETNNGVQDADFSKVYAEAIQLASNGDVVSLLGAIENLETISAYRDSEALIKDYQNRIETEQIKEEQRRLEEQRQLELKKIEQRKQEEKDKRVTKYTTYGLLAVVAIVLVVIFVNATTARMNESKYNSAVAKYNSADYEEALSIFEKIDDYSDSQEYITDINNKLLLYSNGISYYEAGSYMEAIEAFNQVGNYAETKTYVDKISATLYEQAQNDYNAQDYVSAKAKLELIPNTSSVYNDSSKLLQDCSYQYAVSAYNEGQYDKAQAAFIAIGTYSDAQSYLSKIGESYYAQATQLFNQGKYVECAGVIEYIDETTEWNEYTKAVELKEKASNTYIDLVANEAKNVCRNEGYESMVAYINNSKCDILTEDIAQTLIKECEIKIVSLREIQPYVTGDYELGEAYNSEENRTDTMGNVYSYALRGTKGPSYGEVSNTYCLNQQYTIFKATVAVKQGSSSDNSGIIRIYGDGRLLWSDENIRKDTKPFDIEIDISGITDLKIEMYYRGGMTALLCDPMLSE